LQSSFSQGARNTQITMTHLIEAQDAALAQSLADEETTLATASTIELTRSLAERPTIVYREIAMAQGLQNIAEAQAQQTSSGTMPAPTPAALEEPALHVIGRSLVRDQPRRTPVLSAVCSIIREQSLSDSLQLIVSTETSLRYHVDFGRPAFQLPRRLGWRNSLSVLTGHCWLYVTYSSL
jgi:hypothetical protein